MKLLAAALLTLALASPAPNYFTSADHYRIAYYAQGNGPAMLVIPGGPGLDSAYLRDAVKSLNVRSYLIDLRGTGASHVPETPSAITVNHMLQDMERLRVSLHLRNWIVFGHSFGGYLAQAYAAKYPDAVRALVLVSSSAPDLSLEAQVQHSLAQRISPNDQIRLSALRELNTTNPDAAMQQQMDIMLPYFFADRSKWPKVKPYMDPPHNSYAMSRALYRDLGANHVAGSLRLLQAPALIVYGAKDGGVDPFSRAIRANLNSSKLAIVNNAGHFVWVEQPKIFAITINDFLRKYVR